MPEPTQAPVLLTTLETHGLQLTTLLKELDETFPLVNPNPFTDVRVIDYQAGQRSVVEYILRKFNDQQEIP